MVRRVVLLLLVMLFVAFGCGEQQPEEGGGEGGSTEAGKVGSAEGDGELQLVEAGRVVYGTSFVSPLVEAFGDVYIGEGSFVAGNTVLRAAPEQRLDIGGDSNAQDNIIVRSLDESSSIGNRTSLGHHAIIRDSTIGDFAFVGFDAEIVNSTVEGGALISAGAFIENVTIPEDALVPPGAEITTQEQAGELESVTEANEEFKREVLDVNAEFAENYIVLFEEEGYEALIGVGPNPTTSFNPERVEPQIGDTEVGEFVRVIGDVRIGPNSEVSERAAIRADEGSPIVIGRGANIEERVTFHALRGTKIDVGDNLDVGDDSVIHGPLEIGDNLTVGDDSVVFRVRVGDNVTIGDDVTVQGSASEDGELEIPDGTSIPDGAVVTNEEELDEILEEQEE